MTTETPTCSKCGRKLAIIKGTFLCVKCDEAIIYDLQTPWTNEEERAWINRNLGGFGNGGKKTDKKSDSNNKK